MKQFQNIKQLLTGENLRPTVILFTAPLILLSWKYCCSPEAYQNFAPHFGLPAGTAPAAIFHFFTCFILLGVIPALIVKLVFRDNLSDYGLSLGTLYRTVRSFLIMAPVVLLLAWGGSFSPAIVEEYPINKDAGLSVPNFLLHLGTYFWFYLGWEFYFRGFMQFGLAPRFGLASAIMVQVLASSLLHIGKPMSETFGSILGGFAWGIVAYRSQSIASGTAQHFLLGATVDGLIAFRG